MSEWRTAIAEFSHPHGASLILVYASDSIDPDALMGTLKRFIDPTVTILVIGTLKQVAIYIASHQEMYKHSWHICTTMFHPKTGRSRPTERMTMVAVFSSAKAIPYAPEKVLDSMKLEREYPR